jgi:hypothetical protein
MPGVRLGPHETCIAILTRLRARLLSFPSCLASHDRDISIGLIGYHLPASSEACQNRGFGSALRQKHQAITLLGLNPATRGFFQFALGIKKGQRKPARYTRSGTPKPRSQRQRHRSIAPAMIAELAGPTASIVTRQTPPIDGESPTLPVTVRMPAIQAAMKCKSSTSYDGCLFNIIHALRLKRRPGTARRARGAARIPGLRLPQPGSALHRARGQPVDQMALQQAEQHRHGDRAQDDAGR